MYYSTAVDYYYADADDTVVGIAAVLAVDPALSAKFLTSYFDIALNTAHIDFSHVAYMVHVEESLYKNGLVSI